MLREGGRDPQAGWVDLELRDGDIRSSDLALGLRLLGAS